MHLFRFNPSDLGNCILTRELKTRDFGDSPSSLTKFIKVSPSDGDIFEVTKDSYMFKQLVNDYKGYSVASSLANGFPTALKVKNPRMCSAESVKISDPLVYYRGQKETSYVVSEISDLGSVVAKLGTDKQWLLQNGTKVEDLWGKYSTEDGGSFQI